MMCDHDVIVELNSLFARGIFVDKKFTKIKELSGLTNKDVLEKLNSLESNLNKGYVIRLIEELAKCYFTLFEEFLSKVKIFQSQSNEISFKKLTKKPNYTCKGSPSVANCIYTKFEVFSKWWEKVGNVV